MSSLAKPTTNATYGAFFTQTQTQTSLGLGNKTRGRPIDKPVMKPSNRVLSAPDRRAASQKYTVSSLVEDEPPRLSAGRLEETISRGTSGPSGRRYSVGSQRGPDSSPDDSKGAVPGSSSRINGWRNQIMNASALGLTAMGSLADPLASKPPSVPSTTYPDPAALQRFLPEDGAPFRYGCYSLPGEQLSFAKENQDSLLFQQSGPSNFIVGVLDGHGCSGGRVSKWVSERLPKKVLQQTKLGPTNAQGVMDEIFRSIQAELMHDDSVESQESGTTAAVCVKIGQDLIVANIGDSRCVLGRAVPPGGRLQAVELTSDHTPHRADELIRITRCGGVVRRGRAGLLGPPRVYNPKEGCRFGLCLTRSVGDTCMASAGVVPKPEVAVHRLGPPDKLLLLASDGVWSVLTSQEAVNVASKCPDPMKAAAEVVGHAKAAWMKRDTSYRDDITAAVIILGH